MNSEQLNRGIFRASARVPSVLLFGLLLALPAGAQNRGGAGLPPPVSNQTPVPQPLGPHWSNDPDAEDPIRQEQRIRALNLERQKKIISDANKLVKLASEFDAEVKNSRSDKLSSDEMHKLATIEKLAHEVKDKMSFTLNDPSLNPPPVLELPIH